MASASTPSANEPAKDLILVHTVQVKPIIKAQISGKMASNGISDVAIVSVHSEKSYLKKLTMIIIIRINYKKRLFFSPEIDFRYETEARKVMVDFKFDILYR